MTDWPDDWFRDGAGRAGSPVAGGDPGAGTQRIGGPGAGSAGGYGPEADRATQPGYARQAYRSGGTGTAYGSPGGWPDQPAARTPGGQRRPAPGGPGSYNRVGGSGRRWLRPRRILGVLAVLVCLALVGSIVSYFYLNSKLTRQNVLVDYARRPVQGSGTNWLITGSDSRQGLSKAEMRKLATGFNVGGQRSDTIMVLHLPSGGGRPLLMSIPRDSYVPIPGYGTNKINAAFSIGGPKLLAETVQNLTGLRIDHYMGIGFGGFVRVVDAVGGVRVCLKAPLVDPAAGLHLHAGCQVLSGAEALGFVRSRHNFASQDLQRVQDQRLFLGALLRKLTSTSVMLNPFKSLPAASGVAGTLTVDQGTSLYQLVEAAFALRNPITTTAPIANANYYTSNAGDALLLNASALAQITKDLNDGQPVPRSLISGSALAG